MKKEDGPVENVDINRMTDVEESVQNDENAVSGEVQETAFSNDGEEQGDVDGEEQGDVDGEEQKPEDVPMLLTAIYPILYLSHQYKVGDALPANDSGMVKAWLDAGTAVWRQPAVESPKAKLRTAELGLPGQAVASEAEDRDNLVGKVPKTGRRKRK